MTRAPGQSAEGSANACAHGAIDWTEPVKPWLITTPTVPVPTRSVRASGQISGARDKENTAMGEG